MQTSRQLSDILHSRAQVVVGSDPSTADFVVNAAHVDAAHARFSRRHGHWFVQDLDSDAGTQLNGSEVRGLVQVKPGDVVRMGEFEFVFAPSIETLPHDPRSGPMLLVVRDARRVVPPGKVILEGVSIALKPGEFVGILGASGSGKSTLIKSLAGLNELSSGTIEVNGAAKSADVLLRDRRIAYLPQEVVIHEVLGVATALRFIAALKGVGTDAAERDRAIERVLQRVGLSDRAHVPIHRLSGGQRKRVALAAELLGDPGMLLLDEATSGLDPATESDMMRLFQSLAREGKTVVCITHFPGRLALCDRLIYLMAGRRVFDGPVAEMKEFFEVGELEDVYTRQHARSPEDWLNDFQRSKAGESARARLDAEASIAIDRESAEGASAQPAEAQFSILVSRYLRVLLADWRNLALVLAQAPIIGLMLVATFGDIRSRFAELHAARTKEVTFLLVLSVLWCSGTASVREIVRESAILQHERRFGVRPWPYLMSKIAVLGVLAIAQALLLLGVVRFGTGLSGDLAEQAISLCAVGVVGSVIGLAVSAVAGTSERAMTILPVVLIGQAIFSGGVARLEGVVLWIAQLFSPAYWALDGMRSTVSSALRMATYPGAPGEFQPAILGAGGPLLLDLGALAAQCGALLWAAWYLLSGSQGAESLRVAIAGLWRRALRLIRVV